MVACCGTPSPLYPSSHIEEIFSYICAVKWLAGSAEAELNRGSYLANLGSSESVYQEIRLVRERCF